MYRQLYKARRENGLKQKFMAEMLHIHPVTYHKKESGKSDFELREAFFLADYFGLTVDELFEVDESKITPGKDYRIKDKSKSVPSPKALTFESGMIPKTITFDFEEFEEWLGFEYDWTQRGGGKSP